VSETQLLTVALSTAPTMIAVLIGILMNSARFGDLNTRFGDLNGRLGDFRSYVDTRFNDTDRRFNEVTRRIEELDKKMDQRFDDMKATWRSELHRVEEVLDARLKHLEER
jgi:hypothetical protein